MAFPRPMLRLARLTAARLLIVAGVWLAAASQAWSQPLFSFAQISDSQPRDSQEWAVFEQVLDVLVDAGQPGALIPEPLDFVLFAGDLVDNGSHVSEWDVFLATIDPRLTANGIPYLAVPGNHDVKDGGLTNYEQFIADSAVWDSGVDVVTGQNGPVTAPGWIGLRFIGFNNSNGDDNLISSGDLAEIEDRVLEAGALGENVFLLCHHPHDQNSRIPLASTLEEPNVIGYMRGHAGSPHADRGLDGISNPDVWDLASNAVRLDGAILYYEVFETEIRVYVIELFQSTTQLPSPATIPLLHPIRPAEPPVAPTADFAASPSIGPAPLQVSFSDLSQGSPTQWLWDFGDGDTSTERNPSHTYADPGSYDVALSVSNGVGSDSSTRTGFITVQAPLPSLTYLPAADARVKNTSPTTNYGADDRLRIRAGADIYDSYLQFEVSGLGGSGILSARLRLYVTDASDDGGTLYETAGGWDELGITWDNAPPRSGAALGSAGPVGAGTWIEFDVSDVVAGDGTYAFVLVSSSSNSGYFSSREGENPPQLVVETSSLAAPQADFVGAPLDGSAPLAVAFSDLSSGPPDTWLWDFGDGASATQQHPVHTYAEAGIYSVTLTVTNSMGSSSLTKTSYVAVDPPAPPVADFSWHPASGAAPLEVAFEDLSTGSPASWLWDFGDGATSTEQNPSHTYTAEGSYDVSLTAGNGLGSDTLVQEGAVTVVPALPTATFIAAADSRIRSGSPSSNYGDDDFLRIRDGEHEAYLMFDVSGVGGSVDSALLRIFVTDPSDDGGSVYETSNDWTELGLTWNNAPGPSGSALDAAGAVSEGSWLELDVTDAVSGDGVYSFVLQSASGNSAYFSSREGVSPPELVVETNAAPVSPVADFSASPLSGEAPLTVAFSDLSSNAPSSWLWDFGDGNSSALQNPSHVYGSEGVYDVSLTVSNGAGSDTRMETSLVTVTAPVDPPPSVTITAPADGTSVQEGTTLTFAATASDDPDGDLSGSVVWRSSLQGSLGSGASVTRSDLTVGTHQITAEVTDSGGTTVSDQITVTVTAPVDPPPSVQITAPADGSVIDEATPITFVGTASDPVEGDLSGSIVWSSDKDGPLGTGASITTSDLSKGNHGITALVVDSAGNEASALINVRIKNSRAK